MFSELCELLNLRIKVLVQGFFDTIDQVILYFCLYESFLVTVKPGKTISTTNFTKIQLANFGGLVIFNCRLLIMSFIFHHLLIRNIY